MLKREHFHRAPNPLLTLARPAIQDAVIRKLHSEQVQVANDLDLVLQTMLSLCCFEVDEVWAGGVETISVLRDAILEDQGTGIARALGNGIDLDDLVPNRDLIELMVSKHLERHESREAHLERSMNGLSSFLREDPFTLGDSTAVISTRGRSHGSDRDGHKFLSVVEKHSNRRVYFRRVDSTTSRAYAEMLHYIHSPRPDEAVAFGAFLDGHEFPFAWASYSPIGARLERRVAGSVMGDSSVVLEMARAWNTSWSPKNTLSTLFAFAHRELQGQSRVNADATIPPVSEAVITAINPNLGFSGMAFRGVDFDLVALKPTRYTFLIEESLPVYMLESDIANALGIETKDVQRHPQVATSRFPLLPTHLLMVLFNGRARNRPSGPVRLAS